MENIGRMRNSKNRETEPKDVARAHTFVTEKYTRFIICLYAEFY
jgi:hypothetical protein